MSTAPLVDSRRDPSGITTTYQTVQLDDGNIWLAENFNYFLNDNVCQTYEGCGDEAEADRKDGVGLYYDWHAFAPNLGLVPAGWHLPTVDEWKALVTAYGGTGVAYKHLVEGGSSGLNMQLLGGTYFPNQDCSQLAMQGLAFFWSSSQGDDTGYAAILMMEKDQSKAEILYERKEYRFSVRLVKDK